MCSINHENSTQHMTIQERIERIRREIAWRDGFTRPASVDQVAGRMKVSTATLYLWLRAFKPSHRSEKKIKALEKRLKLALPKPVDTQSHERIRERMGK